MTTNSDDERYRGLLFREIFVNWLARSENFPCPRRGQRIHDKSGPHS